MAGINSIVKLVTKRVASSSLIEVITSLLIITMILGIAMMIYLNIQRSGAYASKFKSEMILSEVFQETLRKSHYESRELVVGDVAVFVDVQAYAGNAEVMSVKLEARDANGKLIAEQKHLVYDPQ